MNTMICICGKNTSKELFKTGEYSIRQCSYCGQIRTAVSPVGAKKSVYAKEDMAIYITKEREFRHIFKRIITFIRRYKKKGRFLDIGAGVGLLVSEAKNAGFEGLGFEPSKPGVAIARKLFNIRLIKAMFSKELLHKPVDVVIINHVIEHVEQPRKLIGDIHMSLATDGILVVGVPNIGSLLAQFKKGRWQSLIPQQHRWHFTKKTLDALVVPQGFKRIGIATDNHDRSMHPAWKRPFYAILDLMTQVTKNGEAILVVYRKI